MERFSSAFWKTQLCCLSLYRGKKTNWLLHIKRREMRGWKEMHKPTYAQKCGSSIYCPQLYLLYSEPSQWFFLSPSLTNRNTCSNLLPSFTWHPPIHAETSLYTSILIQQPCRCSVELGEVVISAPWEFNLNGRFSPIKWVGEHLWTSPSPNSGHCSNEHTPSALIWGSDPAEHMLHRQCVLSDPQCWGTKKMFLIRLPIRGVCTLCVRACAFVL